MALAGVLESNLATEQENAIESEASEISAEEEEDADHESSSEADDDEEGNAGWADSIAKVLSSTKPKSKKSVVLSRAKKVSSVKESTKKEKEVDYGFEVDGEVKEEKPDKEQLLETIKARKNVKLPLRVRPSWKDIERERTLRKVATRGVVQLFNAVRMQQKDLQQQLDEAGPLDSRKDAVFNNINKKKFLDVLMSGNRAKSEAVDNAVKYEKKEESSDDEDDTSDNERKRKSEWSVLRPDYMTNKKIKHWDEEDEDENEDGANQSNGSSEDDQDE